MNLKKTCLAFFSACLLFIGSSFSAKAGEHLVEEHDPSTIYSQFQELLEGVELPSLNGESTVLVDFMLTARGEIIVLSTNDKSLDDLIKSKLNYKKLKKHDLTFNKTYTLPIVFKSKSNKNI